MSRKPAAPRASTAWIATLLLLTLGGCGAGWRRLEDLTPRPLPVRAQVQLWMGRQTRVLHAVTVGSDSVSGVPFHLPPECDRCRVAVARHTIDSMCVGNQERGALRSLGLAISL